MFLAGNSAGGWGVGGHDPCQGAPDPTAPAPNQRHVACIHQFVAWFFLTVVEEQIQQSPMRYAPGLTAVFMQLGAGQRETKGVAVQVELNGFDWAWNEIAVVYCTEQTMQAQCLVV